MKNTWKNLFFTLLSFTIFILILGPLIMRIPFIGSLIRWWFDPIKSIQNYMVLFGATLGAAVTISAAMWQSEYNTNKMYMAGEKRNLKYLLNEIDSNMDFMALIKNYFDKNKIEKIYFYPEGNREIWSQHGGQEVNVSTKNNRGIMHLKPQTNKKFLMDEIFTYEEMVAVEELYKRFDFINTNNDLEKGFVDETYELCQSVQEDLSDFVSEMI